MPPGGIIVPSLLGIAGAVLGGFLGRSLGWSGPTDSAGFLMTLAMHAYDEAEAKQQRRLEAA
jgi:uncharacterized membrane protein YeaQ/YmgE (transglycosylase-associated protein family)